MASSFPTPALLRKDNDKYLHMLVMVNHMQGLPWPLCFLPIMFTSEQTRPPTLLPKRKAQPGMKPGISLHLSVPHIPQIVNNDVPLCFPKRPGLNLRESKAQRGFWGVFFFVFFCFSSGLFKCQLLITDLDHSILKTTKKRLHMIVKGSLTKSWQWYFLSVKHSIQRSSEIVY